ncbi:MAG: agmatinase [Spirochaetota bacterium]
MKKEKPPFNFSGLEEKYSDPESSSIVILPVPFDRTSTWRRGARKGPRAIIEASRHMELYDIETGSEVYRKGIHTQRGIKALTPEGIISKVYRKVMGLLDDKKFIVILGGEHTVSIGGIRAFAAVYDDLSVLHLDAHTDMRNSYEGSRFSHACVMARVKEMIPDTVSVGIRSTDSSELNILDPEKVFYAEEMIGSDVWIKRVIKMLKSNVYITIDLDVFDPGIMPSTGTPEPGGLNWYQVTGLLKEVSGKRNIVGFDVVELCPSENIAPDFLAAKLVYKLLSYVFNSKASGM